MPIPVIDLHCDLLSYLQVSKERTPFDAISRSSYQQMREGGVRLQVLAIFTITEPGSTRVAREQIECYLQLLNRYKNEYAFFTGPECFEKPSDKIFIIPAFENASGFCEEDEPLERALARLNHLYETMGRILYISLTWNDENRFGGGNNTTVGLKEDGKQLLRWMDQKRIAVDLSHTSDALAHDILNFIDQNNLKVPVLASHSNFRSITNVARNLPDELAREIIRRRGVIGFNLFRPFVGAHDQRDILKHAEHGLGLQGEKALCFGADFFCDTDFPGIQIKYNADKMYFDEYGNSSGYPHILKMFEEHLSLPRPLLHNLASGNILSFMQ